MVRLFQGHVRFAPGAVSQHLADHDSSLLCRSQNFLEEEIVGRPDAHRKRVRPIPVFRRAQVVKPAEHVIGIFRVLSEPPGKEPLLARQLALKLASCGGRRSNVPRRCRGRPAIADCKDDQDCACGRGQTVGGAAISALSALGMRRADFQ